MADTQNNPDESIVEIEVTIDKASPATPGDKFVRKIVNLKTPPPPEYQFWDEDQKSRQFPITLRNNTVYEKENIMNILSKWDGKEPIVILNRLHDIVPYAGLIEPPLWQVKTQVSIDEIPLAGKQEDSAKIPLRVDAFLSFDLNTYTFPSNSLLLKKNKQPKGSDFYMPIYDAICNNKEDVLLKTLNDGFISSSSSRLLLSQICEGEWLLPIYVNYVKGVNKKDLLTYIKVTINWGSKEAKPDTSSSAKDDTKSSSKT